MRFTLMDLTTVLVALEAYDDDNEDFDIEGLRRKVRKEIDARVKRREIITFRK